MVDQMSSVEPRAEKEYHYLAISSNELRSKLSSSDEPTMLFDIGSENRYKIEHIPGSRFMVCVVHHNPKYYSNPEVFDPDRWTKNFKSTLPRFSYFPFGGGNRGCVGEPFPWIEGILVLATIYSKWKMIHDPEHKVEMKPPITLRPKYGMRMKLERRR